MWWLRVIPWGLVFLVSALVGGCGGSGSDSDSGGDPSTITVAGTVVSSRLVPVAGVAVVIEGHPLVLTDALGQFVVTGVTPPYTAAVLEPDTGTATVYQGLTREDPYVLRDYFVPASAGPCHANVAGSVFGGLGFPTGSDIVTQIWALPAHWDTNRSGAVDELTGGWAVNQGVTWVGPYECPVFLYAIQKEMLDPTTVLAYHGYGMRALDVYDGEVVLGQTLDLEPVATYVHSGTVGAPAGVTISGKNVSLEPWPGQFLSLSSVTDSAPSFTLRSPGAPGATATIEIRAGNAEGSVNVYRRGLVGDTAGLHIELPDVPTALQPADGATGVWHDTRFVSTSEPDRVKRVEFRRSVSHTHAPSFTVITTATEVRIPDLSAYGFGLHEATPYRWNEITIGPLTTVDEAAGRDGLWPERLGVMTRAWTATRSFTTQP